MAGFKIKLIDETYVGFSGSKLVRTTFKEAHLYSTVLSATDIVKFMLRYRDIKAQDKPVIVNNQNEIIKKDIVREI